MQGADAASAARNLVRSTFPDANVALLAGGSARGMVTPTSDLDVIVVLAGPPAPYRETVRHDGQLAELFVHTEDSLDFWWHRDAEDRRNALADMCANSVVLVDDGSAAAIQRRAVDSLAAGPAPLSEAELAWRRYALTDAMDDLVGAGDADERDAIAGVVTVAVGELALLVDGRWLGRGKWLVRRLREVDGSFASRLSEAHRCAVVSGDVRALVDVADEVLDRVGGRLAEGFRAE